MLAITEKDMQMRWDRGYKKHQAHMMGKNQVHLKYFLHLFAYILTYAYIIIYSTNTMRTLRRLAVLRK